MRASHSVIDGADGYYLELGRFQLTVSLEMGKLRYNIRRRLQEDQLTFEVGFTQLNMYVYVPRVFTGTTSTQR